MDEDLADAAASIAAFAARPSFRFTKPELVEAIRDLHAVASAATGVLAGLVHEAVGLSVPTQDDATSTVTWLRDLLRITPAEARTLTSLGDLLAGRPRLADALTAGVVNTSQAAAIGQVLDDVPDFAAAANGPGGVEAGSGRGEPTDVLDSADSFPDPGDGIGGRSLVDDVEAELVGFAAQFEPRFLRQLGQRILAHVNPFLADQRLRERPEREERHARARRGLTLSADGLGGIRLFGRLDVEAAATITAAISPLTVPVTDADGPDLRTAAARRADALVDVCRLALRTGDLRPRAAHLPRSW